MSGIVTVTFRTNRQHTGVVSLLGYMREDLRTTSYGDSVEGLELVSYVEDEPKLMVTQAYIDERIKAAVDAAVAALTPSSPVAVQGE